MKRKIDLRIGRDGKTGYFGVWDMSEKGWERCQAVSELFLKKEQAQQWIDNYTREQNETGNNN